MIEALQELCIIPKTMNARSATTPWYFQGRRRQPMASIGEQYIPDRSVQKFDPSSLYPCGMEHPPLFLEDASCWMDFAFVCIAKDEPMEIHEGPTTSIGESRLTSGPEKARDTLASCLRSVTGIMVANKYNKTKSLPEK
ncbi:hypothetical protein DMENIID0001_170770 [Sergentomyia squamirostris]